MPIAAALPAIAAGVSAVGGAVSLAKGLSGGSDQSAANANDASALATRQQAADLWNAINTPQFNTTPYQGQTWLQDYVPETYDPWIGQVYLPGNDAGDLSAQNAALHQLQGLSQPGLLPSDIAQLNQIERAAAASAASQNATAQSALRNEGLGGSGAALAARLSANQNAAENANSLYSQALQAALTRQLNATTAAGNQANTMQQQASALSQNMAAANNQFNTQVQQLRTAAAQNAANVRNQAQAANLAGRQSVANYNTGIANQNLDRQNQLQQQNYNNQVTKVQGQGNALNGVAQQYNAQAAAFGQQAAGAQANLGQGLQALSNVASSAGGPNGWMTQLTGNNGNNATLPATYATGSDTPDYLQGAMGLSSDQYVP